MNYTVETVSVMVGERYHCFFLVLGRKLSAPEIVCERHICARTTPCRAAGFVNFIVAHRIPVLQILIPRYFKSVFFTCLLLRTTPR